MKTRYLAIEVNKHGVYAYIPPRNEGLKRYRTVTAQELACECNIGEPGAVIRVKIPIDSIVKNVIDMG